MLNIQLFEVLEVPQMRDQNIGYVLFSKKQASGRRPLLIRTSGLLP